VKDKTPLGVQAKDFMDNGQLVPDSLIINVINERLKEKDCVEKGWLLDGFPRTRLQAEALGKTGQVPDTVLLLDVNEDILVERVTGRRTDPDTGTIYHMKFKVCNVMSLCPILVSCSYLSTSKHANPARPQLGTHR